LFENFSALKNESKLLLLDGTVLTTQLFRKKQEEKMFVRAVALPLMRF
jgi:hypothetical protein